MKTVRNSGIQKATIIRLIGPGVILTDLRRIRDMQTVARILRKERRNGAQG